MLFEPSCIREAPSPPDDCLICLGDLKHEKLWKCISCNQRTHRTCAESWFKVSPTCPVCRASAVGEFDHRWLTVVYWCWPMLVLWCWLASLQSAEHQANHSKEEIESLD